MSKPLRVVIVDDHQMFREGIRTRLDREEDFQVVGEASSAEAALEIIGQTSPDLAIIDIRLPDMSGIQLTRLLRRQRPDLKVLILSGYDFDQYVRAAIRAGINGYILKDSPQEKLVEALREISVGGAVLPPGIASKVMRSYAADSRLVRGNRADELTLREIDILELIHQGFRNAEIGRRLSISPRTVEAHVGNIISKLGADSRTDAVRIALEKNLIR